MKILYVHHNPGKGGSSNSLRLMLESLVKQADIELLITCPPGPAFGRFEKSGFNVIPSPIPYPLVTTSGVRFQLLTLARSFLKKRNYDFYREIFQKYQPDIIHFNEIGLYPYVKIAKKMGFKTVLHSRVAADHRFKRINKYVIQQINNFTDHLIAIDHSVIESLKGLEAEYSVVYNPFHITEDLKLYKPDHLDDPTINVTFLSNLLVHKGIKDVIRTAVILKNKSNIRFNIAGSNVRDQDFYSSLPGKIFDLTGIYPDLEKWADNQIRSYNLTNVDMLGHVSDIDSLLKNTHILLMPNHMNEPSRSVFEAGIYGIPSIISLKDKVEDLVEDGYNGFIVSEKSPHEIAEKILELEKNRDLLKRMGQNARSRFLNLNDSKKSAEQIFAVYKSLSNS